MDLVRRCETLWDVVRRCALFILSLHCGMQYFLFSSQSDDMTLCVYIEHYWNFPTLFGIYEKMDLVRRCETLWDVVLFSFFRYIGVCSIFYFSSQSDDMTSCIYKYIIGIFPHFLEFMKKWIWWDAVRRWTLFMVSLHCRLQKEFKKGKSDVKNLFHGMLKKSCSNRHSINPKFIRKVYSC